ncbi:MAG: TspO/MBR family protein [Legionella sp.]|nr:TspO/MBR family protein [Legionella sp.]
MRLNNSIKLVFWVVAFQLMGFLSGLLTQANIDPWYQSLNKSSLTPPAPVFFIAWTLLYVMLAIVAWILSSQKQTSNSKTIIYLFALQMLMNWAWTPLFFQFHWLKFSAVWLIALTILNFILIIQAKARHKTITLLLIPYVIWLVFAAYLNITIALMN